MNALIGLETRLRLAKLQLICDARGSIKELADFTTRVFAGGVDIIQLRDSRLNQLELITALSKIIELAPRNALVATDQIAIAQSLQTDVLHLRSDFPATAARKSTHQWILLGRSIHREEQLTTIAEEPGLDYLFVKAVPPLVRAATRQLPPFAFPNRNKPWFVAGGVTTENIGAILADGARRICVSRAITNADDPKLAAEKLKQPLLTAWENDPAAEQYRNAALL